MESFGLVTCCVLTSKVGTSLVCLPLQRRADIRAVGENDQVQFTEAKTVRGHSAGVNFLKNFAGKLWSFSWDSTMRLWDADGRCLKVVFPSRLLTLQIIHFGVIDVPPVIHNDKLWVHSKHPKNWSPDKNEEEKSVKNTLSGIVVWSGNGDMLKKIPLNLAITHMCSSDTGLCFLTAKSYGSLLAGSSPSAKVVHFPLSYSRNLRISLRSGQYLNYKTCARISSQRIVVFTTDMTCQRSPMSWVCKFEVNLICKRG